MEQSFILLKKSNEAEQRIMELANTGEYTITDILRIINSESIDNWYHRDILDVVKERDIKVPKNVRSKYVKKDKKEENEQIVAFLREKDTQHLSIACITKILSEEFPQIKFYNQKVKKILVDNSIAFRVR